MILQNLLKCNLVENTKEQITNNVYFNILGKAGLDS